MSLCYDIYVLYKHLYPKSIQGKSHKCQAILSTLPWPHIPGQDNGAHKLPDAVVIERVPPGLLVQFIHQVQQCVRTDDLVADVRT